MEEERTKMEKDMMDMKEMEEERMKIGWRWRRRRKRE